MNKEQTVRLSNFELMRIIAIISILINHYVVFGLGEMSLTQSNLYVISSHFLAAFAKVGVNLFILTTGYFMINRSGSIKHVVKIVIDTLFYSYFFLILFLFVIPDYANYTLQNIYYSLLPISTGKTNWFVQTYLILYILIPFLNNLFFSTSRECLKNYLIILAILWFLIPTFTYQIRYSGSDLLYFIYLYILGGYIKNYGIEFFNINKNRIITIISACLIILIYMIICKYLNLNNYKYWLHFSNEISIFTLLISLSVFFIFKDLKIRNNKIINFFAASSLSVYLIHTNMKKELFTKIFHCCDYCNLKYLIINLIIMIVSVYAFPVIFDYIKNKIFINKLNTLVNNSKLIKYLDNILFNKKQIEKVTK